MNIYLDIDGVLLTKEGKPAIGVEAFLKYLTENHECFWLTSHCQGDTKGAINHLDGRVSAQALEYAKRIKPTTFQTWKTDAIDFTKDFRWFDDYIFVKEKQALIQHDCEDKLVKVDLINNPSYLESVKLPK